MDSSNTQRFLILNIALLIAAMTLFIVALVMQQRATAPPPPPPPPPPPRAAAPPPRAVTPRGDLTKGERSTIELFRAASPSVVHITSVVLRQDSWTLDVMQIPRGTGTGFMWDDRGHIVTNFHVIQGAEAAEVTINNGEAFPAKLVGAAPDKDLAVLKIDAPREQLRPIVVGASRDLEVGQSVFAIGNPFGLDQTLTTGVISGLGRQIESVTRRPIHDVIQTDAAINPGNSGGPLLDSAGRLIGVNTAIYSPSGSSAGIGFAVPVDTVHRFVPQLIRHGRVLRPGFGVRLAREETAKRLGVGGVLLLDVVPRSEAARVGLRGTRRTRRGVILGDVIVAIGGEEIRNHDDFYRALDRFEIGQEVTLKIRRGDRAFDVMLTLQANP